MRNRPKAMKRMRPPLLSMRARKISPARAPSRASKERGGDEARDAPSLPLAGEGGGEGDPSRSNASAVPSCGRHSPSVKTGVLRRPMAVISSRKREKEFFALANDFASQKAADFQPCSSIAHLVEGVAPVRPALGVAERPSDSILRPMESILGGASGKSEALTI